MNTNNQEFSMGRSLWDKSSEREERGVGGMGSPFETEIHHPQLFWGFIFGGQKATCIIYRNMLKLVCSTSSDTTMKRLHPLPLSMMIIFLFPDCIKVGKTLGWMRPSKGENCWSLCCAHSDTALWLSHGAWGHVGCVTLGHDQLASWKSLSRCTGSVRNTRHPQTQHLIHTALKEWDRIPTGLVAPAQAGEDLAPVPIR